MTDITKSETTIQAGNKNTDQLFYKLFDLYDRYAQER